MLSTLVQEMVHLWQHHFGKPGRRRYLNKQWADKMDSLGPGLVRRILKSQEAGVLAMSLPAISGITSKKSAETILDEARRQTHYARRNEQAAKSHHNTRNERLREMGIDPDKYAPLSPNTTTPGAVQLVHPAPVA